MGVSWKSSSLFKPEPSSVGGHAQQVVFAQLQRFLVLAEVQGSFQVQAAVGRIDERDAAVAADGNIAARAAAAQHEIVVIKLLAAADIDRRFAVQRQACRRRFGRGRRGHAGRLAFLQA